MFPFPVVTTVIEAAVVTYVSTATDTSNGAIYTFTGQNIGTPAADRYLVVEVGGSGGTTTLSGVTVGGTPMTIHVQSNNATGCSAICGLLYPSGSTADIVVTFSGSKNRAGIGVHTLNKLQSTTPVHTNSAFDSTNADVSTTINYQEGGAVIGAAWVVAANGQSWTWTNLTEDFDSTVESNDVGTAANKATTSTVSGETITATLSTTGKNKILAVASWR